MSSSSDEGKLFIGGIGWDTTEEKLKDHFSQHGNVAHAMIMHDRVTGHPRGFGFVVFSDPSVVPSVLQKTHIIDGRTVEAKKAMSREQQQSLKSGSRSFVGTENFRTKKIFVGGLTSNITEDELRQYFQDYGSITDVAIIYDQNTGRPRGFGFITFTTEEAVDNIIQKTFHELQEKRVEVKRALPKDAAISSRGGYRGFNSYNYSPRIFTNQMGGNRFMQPPQPSNPPYTSYGASTYGYGVGNSNVGYSPYSGYGVGGYGSASPGYMAPPDGVYGNPNANFSKNQWRGLMGASYAAPSYGQNASFGPSVPWRNASRSSPSGYTQAGRSPGASSGYVTRGYNYSSYGVTDASQASAGGAAAANAGQPSPGGYMGRTSSGGNNGS